MSNDNSLEHLTKRLLAFRNARDWSKFHTPKNLAISVSIEAAELLEIFQWCDDRMPVNSEQVTKVSDEAADILIYLLLLCERTGVDLIKSTAAKIDRNESRFPVPNNVERK
ncbi:nucleotide pyrophosphohydrolase [Acetobacter indonesiensis]|uniref:nucleotide pyrophosphohydrolase n=1 Tax=Acetobacter indonesiensis TaxID=104101 RepID=UPI0039E8E53F